MLLIGVAKRAAELDDLRQRNLAAHIVNTLGKALRK
jgi:hypothetical protein